CDCHGPNRENRTVLGFRRLVSTPPSLSPSILHPPTGRHTPGLSHHRRSRPSLDIDPGPESNDAGCHPRAASFPRGAVVAAFVGAPPASRFVARGPHSAAPS